MKSGTNLHMFHESRTWRQDDRHLFSLAESPRWTKPVTPLHQLFLSLYISDPKFPKHHKKTTSSNIKHWFNTWEGMKQYAMTLCLGFRRYKKRMEMINECVYVQLCQSKGAVFLCEFSPLCSWLTSDCAPFQAEEQANWFLTIRTS